MQPDWRKMDGWPMARESRDDEQWKELAKGGKNGFSLAIVALIWWGAKTPVDEGEGSLNEFCSALEDVTWVLGEIVRNAEAGGGVVEGLARRGQLKRALEDDEGVDVSGGKKRYVFISSPMDIRKQSLIGMIGVVRRKLFVARGYE